MLAHLVTIGIPDFLIVFATIAIWIWLWRLRSMRVRIWVRRIIFGTLAIVFDTYAAYGAIFIIWRPKTPEYRLSVIDWAVSLLASLLGVLFSWRFAVWVKRSTANNDTTEIPVA